MFISEVFFDYNSSRFKVHPPSLYKLWRGRQFRVHPTVLKLRRTDGGPTFVKTSEGRQDGEQTRRKGRSVKGDVLHIYTFKKNM